MAVRAAMTAANRHASRTKRVVSRNTALLLGPTARDLPRRRSGVPVDAAEERHTSLSPALHERSAPSTHRCDVRVAHPARRRTTAPRPLARSLRTQIELEKTAGGLKGK